MPKPDVKTLAGTAVTSALLALTGCAVPTSNTLPAGCTAAPSTTAARIKAAARVNFLAGDTQMARVDILKIAAFPLPVPLHQFGMVNYIAVLIAPVFAHDPRPSAEETVMFATNAKGTLFYPIDPHEPQYFHIAQPTQPAIRTWEQSAYQADAWGSAYQCVNN